MFILLEKNYRLGLRLFGGLNILFSLYGLLVEPLFLVGFLRAEQKMRNVSSQTPFYLMAVASSIFLLFLFIGSIYLLRLRRLGLTICAFAFLSEMIYGYGLTAVWLIRNSPASASSGMNSSL